jgi:hypothetical protein
MIPKRTTLLCAGLGTTLLAARVDAQPETEPDAKPAATATAGAEGTDQLTLPKGRAVVDAFLEVNLNEAFKPISISPDLWYGATDDITVGLVHSSVGETGVIGGFGNSLCLSGTGTGSGCTDFYPGFGLDARYKLKTGMFAWAADGGLLFNHISDPLKFSLKLGAVGRWHSGQLAIELQPNLAIGITNRSTSTMVGGVTVDTTTNPDFLTLPVTGIYAVTPVISVSGQLGVVLPLEDTGDNYSVPLSIGGHYQVNESLSVTLAFSLLHLVGGSLQATGFDARSLTLGGTYAL